MKTRIIIVICTVIIVSNFPIFNFISLENFTYANKDNTFQYSEEGGKGNSYKSCLITYGCFLCQHPDKDQGDNRLYRTFTIKPWRFWEWREMIFHNERFTLPYLEPKK